MLAALEWGAAAFAAAQLTPTQLPQTPRPDLQSIPRAPVPNDPLELVTGGARTATDPQERAAAIEMLLKARRLSNVRAQGYDLKTRFTSTGTSPYDGQWELEDVSPGAGMYRWSAQGPSYSGAYIYDGKVLYSDQQAAAMPLRVLQVRESIFYIYYPQIDNRTQLRVATGRLDGSELRCILIGPGVAGSKDAVTAARSWYESEYCIDPASGLLMLHSPAPGLYIRYDYASAVRFHDVTIPGRFYISEAGRQIIEAVTESVTEPVNRNAAIFSPAGMHAVGEGPMMGPASRVRDTLFPARSIDFASASMHMIELRGVVAPDRSVTDVEVLATSDPSMDEKALERAKRWRFSIGNAQPGTTPFSHEVFFTFQTPALN